MLEFKLPEVGENITSGTVVDVFVSVGDTIKKDQDLLEIETDKASLPVPSPCNGVVKEILITKGEEVKIGAVVMKIEEFEKAQTKENGPAAKKEPSIEPAQASAPKQEEVSAPAKPAQALKPQTQSSIKPNAAIPPQSDVPAAPSVRRLARELGIEVGLIAGTGPGGRISKDDVKAYAKMVITGGVQTIIQSGPIAKPLPDFSKFGPVREEKMSKIRHVTGVHLSHCWTTIPHVTQFGKADITELEKVRKAHSTEEKKLTITPFLLKILAEALKEFPQFNSSVDLENSTVIYKEYINLGVAVDTDRGLLVPVLRDVDKKNIFDINDEVNAMAERARTKKTGLDELKGGSMTLTNLGGIFGTQFTPIVNWPEVAILGVSRGAMEPVWNKEKNEFVPRFMLPFSLSYDHRIIDGADGARFLKWVCQAVETRFNNTIE